MIRKGQKINMKSISKALRFASFVSVAALGLHTCAVQATEKPRPTPVIFDTDMGNDCDDVQALAMIHALQSRGECELIGVTITKDHELAAPFTDVINTFYGRGDIPIGVCRSGVTPAAEKFNLLADAKVDGEFRYPHDLISGKDAPEAVPLLRKLLAEAQDSSVVICQVGFSTNLANLLDSQSDAVSPLSGKELVKQKVKLTSVMAAAFTDIPHHQTGVPGPYREYNVIMDIPAARKFAAEWPAPIVWSGFEIGLNLPYPYRSVAEDYQYVKDHPVAEAYNVYITPPHNRPTWDLTSVLYAIRPDHNYFDLSDAGNVTILEDGHSKFEPSKDGRDRYLILKDGQKERILEALMLLSSQPPSK